MTRPGPQPARTWVPASTMGGRRRPTDRPSSSRTGPGGASPRGPGKPLVQGESACKPASVPRRFRGGGHPSGTDVAAGLVRSTRGLGRASLHGRVAAAGASPIRPCSGWGLPSRPVTRPLVRSYRTVSPLPVRSRGPAVCSLWHFPAGRPDWPLASTLPFGAPTFLDACGPVARNARAATTRPARCPTSLAWHHGARFGQSVR